MNKETEFEIDFKPINKGLGLDHFADGLPYAPKEVRKNREQLIEARQGSRKMSRTYQQSVQNSGAPVSVSSELQDHDTNALARRINESFADGIDLEELKNLERELAKTQATASRAEPNKSEEVVAADLVQPALFVWRMAAYGVDFVIIFLIFIGILFSAAAYVGTSVPDLARQHLLLLSGFFGVLYLAYFLIQELVLGTTFAKNLFGIRLRANSRWALLGRFICFFVSVLPFGIGLFWYFFDPRKRCWHDVISGSEVVLVD